MTSRLKVGIPGRLDVEWQRGSSGNITCTAPVGVDLTGVTSITALVKAKPGGQNAQTVLTLTPDLTQLASRVFILNLSAATSLACAASTYTWMVRLNGGPLDSRAVVTGSWKHVEEWAWEH